MKRKIRYFSIVLLCLATELFVPIASYAWLNPFKAIGNAVNTITSAVAGSVISVVNGVINGITEFTNSVISNVEIVLAEIGVVGSNIAKSTIEAIHQFFMTVETGEYIFVQCIANIINPSERKANILINKDSLVAYTLPKVDLQITKILPFKWQKVQLFKSQTGASCSDDSDYKFL